MSNHYVNGWKEIAQYLGRGTRTVQRWEQELGLPVRRPRGKSSSAVLALTSELDEWMAQAPSRSLLDTDELALRPLPVRILLIEDSVTDINTCVTLLRNVGAAQVDVLGTIPAALLRLEETAEGKLARPDIIILDLNFSTESGFEVLRFWRSHPQLKSIRVIVWTAMGETEKKLCQAFGVEAVVPKWAGYRELEAALRAS